MRKTSRILNDESFVFGLSFNDISGLGGALLGLMLLSKTLGLKSMLWALILTLIISAMLAGIRMRFRRKIIRDSLFYLINGRVSHVCRNHRRQK